MGFTPSPNVTRGDTQSSGSSHQITGSLILSSSATTSTLTMLGVQTGSQAGPGSFLALDTSDEVVLATPAGGGGGISWDGSTANGVATYKDADDATVQSNLTFDGTTLTVTGAISASSEITGSRGRFTGGSLTPQLVVGEGAAMYQNKAIIQVNAGSGEDAYIVAQVSDSNKNPVIQLDGVADEVMLYIDNDSTGEAFYIRRKSQLPPGFVMDNTSKVGIRVYEPQADFDVSGSTILGSGVGSYAHQVSGTLSVSGSTILSGSNTFGQLSTDLHQVTGTLSISGSQPLVVYGPGPGKTGGPSIIARNTSSVGGANMWQQPVSGALIVSADTWGTQKHGSVMYVHSNGVASTIGFKNSSTDTAGIQSNKVTSGKGAFVGLQNADLFLRNEIGNLILTADGSQEIVVDHAGTTIGNHAFDNHRVSGTLHVSGGIMQQQYFSASISSPVNATCSLYNVFNYHLTANSEVTASSPVAGTSYLFFFRQDGTGTRTVDFSGFKWPGGTAPTLSTAGGAVDIVSGISDGTYIYADTTKNFS